MLNRHELQAQKLLFLGLAIILALISFRQTFYLRGTIGFRHDWSIPPYSDEMVHYAYSLREAFTSVNLGSYPLYQTDNILLDFVGLFALLGGDGAVISRLLPIAFIALSGYGLFGLCRDLKIPPISAGLAATFYLSSPVIFNRVIAGHIAYLMAYALAPVALLSFRRLMKENSVRNFAFCCMLSALTIVQVQYAVFLLIFMLVFALTGSSRIRALFQILGVWATTAFIHAYWVLPAILNIGVLAQIANGALLGGAMENWIIAQSTSLVGSLRLVGYVTRYFELTVSSEGLSWLWALTSLCLLVLVLLPVAAGRTNREVLPWTVLFLVFSLLATGADGPFGFGALFLYFGHALSIAALFREAYHFAGGTTLAFAVLLGFSAQFMCRIFSVKVGSVRPGISRTFIFGIFLALILLNNFVFLSGNYGGNLQAFDFGPSYRSLYTYLQNDPGDYRVLYLPFVQPMRYSTLTFPGIDPMISYSPKETIGPFVGTPLIAYLARSLYEVKNDHLAALIGATSVRYVILRTDFTSALPYFEYGPFQGVTDFWSNANLEKTVKDQMGLEFDWSNGTYVVYYNTLEKPRIYGTYNAVFTSGDFRAIEELLYNDSETAVVSVDQNLAFTSLKQIQALKLLQDSGEPGNRLWGNATYAIKPGGIRFLTDDARQGWVESSGWWWYDDRIAGLVDDGAFTLSTGTLTVPFNLPGGSYLMFARLSTDRPDLVFKVDNGNQFLGIGHQGYPDWVEIGQVNLTSGPHSMSIFALSNGFHLVGDILMVGRNSEPITFAQAPLDTSTPSISYTLEEPGHYHVHIQATRSTFLILSENYNQLWEADLDGAPLTSHLMCNGFSNCWWINRTGDFWLDIIFKGQHYLTTGMMVSSVSLGLVLIMAVIPTRVTEAKWTKKRKQRSEAGKLEIISRRNGL